MNRKPLQLKLGESSIRPPYTKSQQTPRPLKKYNKTGIGTPLPLMHAPRSPDKNDKILEQEIQTNEKNTDVQKGKTPYVQY